MKRIWLGLLITGWLAACGDDLANKAKEIAANRSPDPPSELQAKGGDGTVTLGWSPSQRASGYIILRGTVSGGPYTELMALPATAFVDADVLNGTTYYYVVQAENIAGLSANSGEAKAKPEGEDKTPEDTLPDPQAPAAPSSLVATAKSSSQIDLSWSDGSDNESGFKIERKTGDGAFALIATLDAGAASFSNTGLSASTKYTYRVYAFNAVGNSPKSNEASATTAGGGSPPPPPPPPPPAAPSFSGDVEPILMAKCAGCHPGTSFTRLKLTGTASTDYPTVKALTNTASPSSSLILQKPTNTVAHGGGPVLTVGSAEYNKILSWIQQGEAP